MKQGEDACRVLHWGTGTGYLYFEKVPAVVLYVKITPLYLCLLFTEVLISPLPSIFWFGRQFNRFFPSSGLWLFQPEEVSTKTILPDQQLIKIFAKVRKENVNAIAVETWGKQ